MSCAGFARRPTRTWSPKPKRWAYYPWRRTVASVLGPRGFRAVRLNRNRNLITADEQDRLGQLRIGVVGLSVGHAIAHILAQEGLCGQLRLADFDELELSNLNRVPATVFDLGLNKAKLAARRIAELDPYLPVEVFDRGITEESVDRIPRRRRHSRGGVRLAGHQGPRPPGGACATHPGPDGHRRPRHLWTSSDSIVEPQRQILHGLLGDVDFAELSELPSKDKVPYALRMMDGARLSPRMAASLVEVGNSLATWPQLVAEVAQSAALVAEAGQADRSRRGIGVRQGRASTWHTASTRSTTPRHRIRRTDYARDPQTTPARRRHRAGGGGRGSRPVWWKRAALAHFDARRCDHDCARPRIHVDDGRRLSSERRRSGCGGFQCPGGGGRLRNPRSGELRDR